MLTVKNRYRLVNTVIIVLLCKSGVNVSDVVDVEAEVVLGKPEVLVDVVEVVSDSVKVCDGDAVMMVDVDKEDGKLDGAVKPGEVVIDGKLDTVDKLPVVDLIVELIITGFSGVFGCKIVDELCVLVEVSIEDVDVIVLCSVVAKRNLEVNL